VKLNDVQEYVPNSTETVDLTQALTTLDTDIQSCGKANEVQYQPHFEKFFTSIVNTLKRRKKLQISDGRGASLLIVDGLEASRKPDILITTPFAIGGAYQDFIAAIVELKKGKEDFTNDSKGQLCDYLKSLVRRRQGWMTRAWGILMNHKLVMFIQVNYDESHKLQFAISKSFDYLVPNFKKLPTGWCVGERLGSFDHSEHFSSLPRGSPSHLGRRLGTPSKQQQNVHLYNSRQLGRLRADHVLILRPNDGVASGTYRSRTYQGSLGQNACAVERDRKSSYGTELRPTSKVIGVPLPLLMRTS